MKHYKSMKWRPLCHSAFALLLFLFGVAGGGCGLGYMQDAKTTPKGHLDLHGNMGYVYNDVVKMRGEDDPDRENEKTYAAANYPVNLGARYGIRDGLDIGLKLFLLGGFSTDVKYNFMPPSNPLAVSVMGGVGAADQIWAPKGAWVLNVPVSVMAGYDVTDWLTPYAAIGYNAFWVFGRKLETDTEDVEYKNEWRGHGDGLFVVNAGVKVKILDDLFFLAEYNYWHATVDDPGDYFAFTHSHMVFLGFTVRLPIFAKRHQKQDRSGFETPPEPPPPPPPPPPAEKDERAVPMKPVEPSI